MAKKAEEVHFKSKGRGGGIDNQSNKTGFRQKQFKEPIKGSKAAKGEGLKNFYLYMYGVEESTVENEVVILSDIPVNNPEHEFDDALIWDGLEIAGTAFNQLASDDDPKNGVYDPICDMLRQNPNIVKEQKFVKFPQYGFVMTCIDMNEYEIKGGDRKGEIVGEKRKPLFISQRWIGTVVQVMLQQAKKAGLETLRGTVWEVSRSKQDTSAGIFSPKIGDRWDYKEVLSEDDMFDKFDQASIDYGFSSTEDYLSEMEWDEVFKPLPFEERQEIADMIQNHCTRNERQSREPRGRSSSGGNRSARSARSSSKGSSRDNPRSARSARSGGTKTAEKPGSGRQRSSKREARQSRNEDYTKPEDEEKPEETGEFFSDDDDDDIPF